MVRLLVVLFCLRLLRDGLVPGFVFAASDSPRSIPAWLASLSSACSRTSVIARAEVPRSFDSVLAHFRPLAFRSRWPSRSGSTQQVIRVFDMAKGTVVNAIKYHKGFMVRGLHFSSVCWLGRCSSPEYRSCLGCLFHWLPLCVLIIRRLVCFVHRCLVRVIVRRDTASARSRRWPSTRTLSCFALFLCPASPWGCSLPSAGLFSCMKGWWHTPYVLLTFASVLHVVAAG